MRRCQLWVMAASCSSLAQASTHSLSFREMHARSFELLVWPPSEWRWMRKSTRQPSVKPVWKGLDQKPTVVFSGLAVIESDSFSNILARSA
jgi:hypothetical protein